MKKLFTIFLAFSMFWTSLGLKVQAEEIQDIIPCAELREHNYNKQDYLAYKYDRWSAPMTSYLEKTDEGWMRFIYDENDSIFEKATEKYMIDYFDESFNVTDRIFIPEQLPIFGGFHATENAYYIVTGQENPDNDNSKEVLRVTQYNKKWELVQMACVSGINTTVPFEGGSLRIDDDGTYLYIRTSRKSYSGHQANMTFQFHMGLLTLTDSFTGVMYDTYGYVSHSFNQFIKIDGNSIVAVDHGDAYPRSILLMKYNTDCSDGTFYPNKNGMVDCVTLLNIYGETGENITGASVGGLEISDTHYLVAGSSKPQDENYQNYRTANIFISKVNKNTLKNETVFLTNYSEGEATTSTPQLVKVNDNRFVLLYEVNENVNYMLLDGTGEVLQEATEIIDATLSDCQPIAYNNTITWYAYNKTKTTFFQLDTETNEFSQKTIDTGHKHVALGEVEDGFVKGMCSNCHEQYVVRCINGFWFWTIDDPYIRTSGSGGLKTELEVGERVLFILDTEICVNLDPTKAYDITDFYNIKIMNPSILKWDRDKGYNMFIGLKDGVTKVIFTSKYNPSVSREYLFKVGDYEPYMPPEKVVNLNATNNDNLSITLTWDSSKYASSYEIYYKETNKNSDFILLATTTDTTKTLSDFISTPNTTYTFKVVAINQNGTSEKNEEVNIIVKKLPDVVENIAISQYSNKSVELTWDSSEGAESYDVYCKNISDDLDFEKLLTTTDTKIRINDLLAEETYAFYVVASNRAGLSDPSTQVQITLNYLKPPAPENFRYEQLRYDTVRLSWNPCDGATSYEIYQRRPLDLTFSLLQITTDTTFIVDNLYAGDEFDYYIIAKNELGESKSKILAVEMMLLGKPELSIEEISEGKFKLTWTKIEGSDWYDIYILKPNGNKFEKWHDTNEDSLEYTTDYLLAGDYSFYVKGAANDSVWGDFDHAEQSNIVEATSSYDKPIIQLEANVNDVTISWDKIDGFYYDIYCKGYQENDEFELVKTVSDNKATITDLTQDSIYTFYIIGRGHPDLMTKPSEEVQIKTKKAEIPDVVTNLRIEQDTYNEATLTWNASERAKSYDVYCKGYNGNTEYQLLGTVSDLTFTVSDLQPETTYTFYIVAKNEGGTSDRSNEVEFTSLKNITNLRLEQTDIDTLKVSWDSVEGALSYYVVYDGYIQMASEKVEGTTYSLESLDLGVSYTIYILAYAGSNKIAISEFKSIDINFQDKPVLSVEKISNVKFKLNWTKVEDASYYRVYKKYNDEDYKLLATVRSGTEYVTEELLVGNYDFYVVAYYYLESEPSNIVSVESVYGEIKNVSIYSGPNFAHIVWDTVEGIPFYEVFCKGKNGSDEFKHASITEGNGTTIYGLEKGKPYEFYVIGTNDEEKLTQPSEIVKITIPEQSLNPVENLKAEQVKYNEVKLTWDKVEGATAYRIYDRYGDLLQVVNDTTTNIGNLRTRRSYKFSVVAVNNDNMCALSELVDIYLDFIGEADLSIEQTSSTKFKLTWTPIDGAQRYCVYSSYNGSVYKYLGMVNEGILEYTTSELLPGNYSFYVLGARYWYEDTIETKQSNIVTGVSYFEKPIVTLSSRLNDITISWNDVEAITSYDVYLKGYQENAEFVRVKNVEGNETVISGLNEGKTYTVYIVGKNGELSTEPSDPVQITTKNRPASVTNLQVSQIGPQEVTLTWDLSDDASSYGVYCKDVNGSTSFKLMKTVSQNTVDLINLSSGKTYIFYIVAKNEYGSSNPSEEVQITLKKVVDKTALKALIDEVNSWTDTDKYSLGSWKKVTTSLSNATNIYQNAEATQEEVDAAITDLETQISKLVNRSILKTLIEQAEAILENTDKYSEESVYTLTEKYYKAVYTYEDTTYYTQADCDYKADELDKAIKAMKEKNEVSIPSSVVNLAAEDTTYNKITLTWDASETATVYEVYRKAYDSEEFKLYKTVEDTTVAVTGVMTGKEYAFYVVAKNEMGSAEASETVAKATTLHGKVTLDIEKVSTSKFKLSWNKIDGATRYIVYRKRNDDKMKKVLTLGAKDLTYTTAELPHGDYQFILKAGRYDSADRVMTAQSNKVEGSVEKVAPAVKLTAGSKSIKVSWSKMEGVTHYQVYRATSKDGKYTKLTTTKELSYTAKSLSSGKKYFFKVRGYKLYKSGDDIKYDVYTPYSTIGYAIVK